MHFVHKHGNCISEVIYRLNHMYIVDQAVNLRRSDEKNMENLETVITQTLSSYIPVFSNGRTRLNTYILLLCVRAVR